MREKVCGSEADRKSEKSDMAESLRCPPTHHPHLPPHPPHPPLPLQMEVNVKQSLLLVSGGINSLERDWAAREVNACLSAQRPPTPTPPPQPPPLYFFPSLPEGLLAAFQRCTLHHLDTGGSAPRAILKLFFLVCFLEAQ